MVRRVYLDSSILVPLAVGREANPHQFLLSTNVLHKIENSKNVGVVSPLALMEVRSVLRVKKGRDKHVLDKLAPDEQLQYVLRKSDSMYFQLTNHWLQIEDTEFLEDEIHVDVIKIMANALSILGRVRGKLQPRGNSRFRGVGPADVLHALLAKGIGCDTLVTVDTGFEELASFDEFTGLTFHVLK